MSHENMYPIIRRVAVIPLIVVVPVLELGYEVIYHSEAPKHVVENNFNYYNNLPNYFISGINDTASVWSANQFIISS